MDDGSYRKTQITTCRDNSRGAKVEMPTQLVMTFQMELDWPRADFSRQRERGLDLCSLAPTYSRYLPGFKVSLSSWLSVQDGVALLPFENRVEWKRAEIDSNFQCIYSNDHRSPLITLLLAGMDHHVFNSPQKLRRVLQSA